MFDIAPSELMIVALVAVVLVGPKDLPRVMRFVGHWLGKGRAMMRHFHGALDGMIKEAEVQELERKRKADLAQAANENCTVPAESSEPALAAASPERPALAMAGGTSQ
jgi:sec-independent protein translocase protein TatB